MAGNKIICHCKNVDYITIRKAMIQGARTLDEIKEMTGAATGCGRCAGEIEKILASVCGCKNTSLEDVVNAVKNGAETVEVWGTGTPLREFIYVDDMAAACVFLMENYDGEQHVNIGTGEEVSIRQLAETVKEVVGFEGELVFNTDMPDGTPRKLTTVDKLHGLGFMHKVSLNEGIRMAYEWFLENYK